MQEINMNKTGNMTRVQLGKREILLVGTAHVSRESVDEVEQVILEEKPERICIEIDATRFKTMTEGQDWRSLNIGTVLKQGKGFLLMANLVLTSFQRRMGVNLGTNPGDEMKKAAEIAVREEIPFSFCDREVHVTLRRAWGRSNFWNKNKMLASLLGSIFAKEKLSEEEIEKLKEKSALEDMMEELADYMPKVKEVLIDERDQFLATKIFEAKESKVVAVVGAGHMKGIVSWLHRLHKGEVESDLSEISKIPPPTRMSKILPWLIPAIVVGLIGAGFLMSGWREGLSMFWIWVLVNGTLSALGAIIALAHPLTIILSFIAAPITSLNPTIGVGIVSGIIEATMRKPRVKDFENLHDDIVSIKGFYRNRFTRALLVFFFTTIGSAIGTFIGIPYLTSLLG
ncbi:MAG: TraB/GumN family protein [Spirochaetales bacterium]|jgi:pheromone shutdown-related protein TraB|nr:TraB/GumN family protein [Spirochaetales bacterium]